MYLNRIRPPKATAVMEATKEEFMPESPAVEGNPYTLMSYAELKKLAAERGLKTPRNPKKNELVELLGGSDGQD
jgi:hypothetical protein